MGDCATPIFVEHVECCFELFLGEELILGHGCNDELRVLDLTTFVSVNCIKHLVDFFVSHQLTVVL